MAVAKPTGGAWRALATAGVFLGLIAAQVAHTDASGAQASADQPGALDGEIALAHRLLSAVQDTSRPPAQRALDTARLAVDARLPVVDDRVKPLLGQQVRNLDTSQELLDLGSPEGADTLAFGIEVAKIATEWQAATLGFDLTKAGLAGISHHDHPSEAAIALIEGQGGSVTAAQRAELETLDGLDAAAGEALTDFIDAFILFSAATDLAYSNADIDRIEALLDVIDDPEAVVDLVDSVQPNRLLADLGIDLTPVLAARSQLLDTVPALQAALTGPAASDQESSSAAPIQVAPYLSIELGTATNNTYSQDFWLLLDVGGDDTYLNNAGGAQGSLTTPRFAAALVDILGSDQYRSGRDLGINGGGALGSGSLIDVVGNDVYVAGGTGTNGGGNLGTGLLLDPSGSDSYQGFDRGVNGGGNGGVGMLIDVGGDNSFSATRDGTNGGGDTGGVGFLFDAGGLDTPVIDSHSATDEGTNGGGHLGGVGFLLDSGPHGDSYAGGSVGSNGGSGASNSIVPAGGVGFLMDLGGSDTYAAVDTGVNGGAGVIGAALLVDAGGSDVYSAGDSATNGGAVAGSAALVDVAGNDSYTGMNGGAFLGTGLLFDAGGADRYRRTAGDAFIADQTVVPAGIVGAQIDAPTIPLPPTTLPPVPTTLPTVTTVPLPSTTLPTVTTSTLPTVTTSTLPPVTTSTLPPVTTSTLPPVTTSTLPPVTTSTLPTVTTSTLPDVTTSTLPPVTTSTLPEVTTSTLPEVTTTTLPPPPPVVTLDFEDTAPCSSHLLNDDALFGVWHSPLSAGPPYSVCLVVRFPIEFTVRVTVDPDAANP